MSNEVKTTTFFDGNTPERVSPVTNDFPESKRKSKQQKKLERKLLEKTARKVRKQEEKRKNIGFPDLPIGLSEYYFSDGFRRVYPYYYTYETHTKGRWLQRRIIDVLNKEFNCHSHTSFAKAIESGSVRINNKIVDPNYVLKDNDLISHTVHRHEFPVLDLPIDTVHEDEHTLVVNKPSSIPIHPCGRYNLNSLTFILAKAYGRSNLRLVHRLDRMTSGLMIFGKDYDTANRFSAEISGRQVKKTYLALVEGEFPSSEELVLCDAPIGVLCPKFGVHRILPETEGGKEALTNFRRRHFDPQRNFSVVECQPRTGRTHQIRIHLQFLGHPITNDPIYNCFAWGPHKGKNADYGKSLEAVIEDLSKIHSREQHMLGEFDDKNVTAETHDVEEEERQSPESKRARLDCAPFPRDPNCLGCRTVFVDPTPESLQLFLHAFEYEGPGWSYRTSLPAWAKFEK